MKRGWRSVGALVVGSALLLAGCGGGDDEETTTRPVSGLEGSSGGASTGGSSGESSESGGSGAAALTQARCVEAATALAQAAAGVPGLFSGEMEGLEDSVEAFAAFVDNAPAEIRDDLEVLAGGYAAVIEALTEANFNPSGGETPSAETFAQLAAATEALDTTDFEAAAERVGSWFEDQCGE